ncbi:25S rRNA (adenine645-N1)-methyltransferase [Conglomerata obtusa]
MKKKEQRSCKSQNSMKVTKNNKKSVFHAKKFNNDQMNKETKNKKIRNENSTVNSFKNDGYKNKVIYSSLCIPNTKNCNEMYKICNKEIKITSQPSNLQKRLEDRLKPAFFRLLNDKLYNGKKSLSPANIDSYHEGYTQQVKKWPVNPLDIIINNLKNIPNVLIADLGCGSGTLSRSVVGNVVSLDINSTVMSVRCDIRNTPLKSKVFDVCVLCLAIMDLDGYKFFLEASRITKIGGTIFVAEVIKRTDNLINNLNKMCFRLKAIIEKNNVFVVYEFVKTKDFDGTKFSIPMKVCKYKKR